MLCSLTSDWVDVSVPKKILNLLHCQKKVPGLLLRLERQFVELKIMKSGMIEKEVRTKGEGHCSDLGVQKNSGSGLVQSGVGSN